MKYEKGSIVWYARASNEKEIAYPGDEPCPATVITVHSPTSADLQIMVDNQTPVIRVGVPLVASAVVSLTHYATLARQET